MSNTSTAMYDCDAILSSLPPAPPTQSPVVKTITCSLIALFAAVTLIGNVLVVSMVAKYRQLQIRTNAFIVSVAFADIGVAVFIMPFRIYEEWNGGWELGYWFCLMLTAFDLSFCSVSMANLYSLGIERYLAVCKPFFHQRMQIKVTVLTIATCWILPFVGWFMTLINHWHIIGIEGLVACTSNGACPFFLNMPITVTSNCSFFIPTLLVMYFYLCIFLTARRHMHTIVDLNASESHRKEMLKVKKTLRAALILGIVIGCYCVCWLPAIVVFMLDPFVNYGTPITTKLVVTWLAYLNSMFNPILYYIFNQQFKRAYKATLCCRKFISDDDIMMSASVGN